MVATDTSGTMPGTVTLSAPARYVTILADSTNSFYVGVSSTATPVAASISTSTGLGGVPYILHEPLGIQTLTFAPVAGTINYKVMINSHGNIDGL